MVSTLKSLAISMAGALSVAAIITVNKTDTFVVGSAPIAQEQAFSVVASEAERMDHQHVDCAGQTGTLAWSEDLCSYPQKQDDPFLKGVQSIQQAAAADQMVWTPVNVSIDGMQGSVGPE